MGAAGKAATTGGLLFRFSNLSLLSLLRNHLLNMNTSMMAKIGKICIEWMLLVNFDLCLNIPAAAGPCLGSAFLWLLATG